MTSERWREINALFHAALDREEGRDRDAFLDELAARDGALADEVRSLLGHAAGGAFLESPAWTADPTLLDAAAPLVGRRIGPYRVGEEIGRGGMGIVYAADDARLGRPVALKALPPEYTRDPARRARLRREARAAAALSHPAVATIYALEEIDGDLFMVSELVRGRSLRDELADGPVAADRLAPTLTDLASALTAAHALEIVHRDLKPENIVRRADGQIKVLDFGLAREGRGSPAMPRLTATGMIVGTPGYAAPEQWSGGAVDARADIFSFGVVAWELATGEHPFGPDPTRTAARMSAFLEGRAASGAVPPGRLHDVARRCMRGDPDARYQSAADLLAALEGIGDGSAAASNDRLWWWRFHQGAAAAVDVAITTIALTARGAFTAPAGRGIALAVLTLATVAVTIRLNLLFTSRVHPETTPARRRALFRWIAVAEGAIAAILVAGVAVFGSDLADARLILLVALAVASAASLVVVEPATTTAAGLEVDAPIARR